jgi:prepilin-type processing-associated H-X9-DG protein
MQKYDYYGTSATNAHIASVPAGLALYMGQEISFRDKASMQTELLKGPVRKVFVCPSDREGGRFGATVSDGGDHFNSYAFNEAAMGWADAALSATQDGSVRNHNRLRGHLVRFPHAANLMLLTDGAPRGGDGGGAWQVWYDHDVNCVLGDVITGKHECGESQLIDKTRHRGRMNVGFADGHVQNIVIAVNDNYTSGDLDKISLDVDFPQ